MRSGDKFEKKHSSQMQRANRATTFLFSTALGRVISSRKPAVVLIRARDNRVAILTLSPGRSQSETQSQRFEASGVLGLSDRVAENIEEKEKRSWWKKLLGD